MSLAVGVYQQHSRIGYTCLLEHSDQAECHVGGGRGFPHPTLMIGHHEHPSHLPTLHFFRTILSARVAATSPGCGTLLAEVSAAPSSGTSRRPGERQALPPR